MGEMGATAGEERVRNRRTEATRVLGTPIKKGTNHNKRFI